VKPPEQTLVRVIFIPGKKKKAKTHLKQKKEDARNTIEKRGDGPGLKV